MEQFDSFISLGYFCSVAEELERIGLRSTSSPFDWLVSNFEGVLSAIRDHFDGFLEYDLLCQCDSNRRYYYNTRYRIWFFHDFNPYHSLRKQLPSVSAKFQRRIDRFYENIQKPTLFIRYISDEAQDQDGRSAELAYIEKNHRQILSLLKSFNEKNEIIYLANTEVQSAMIPIYHVDKDEDDVVARRPLEKNEALSGLLMSFDYEPRLKNLDFLRDRQSAKKNQETRGLSRLLKRIRNGYIREYVHDKTIPLDLKATI